MLDAIFSFANYYFEKKKAATTTMVALFCFFLLLLVTVQQFLFFLALKYSWSIGTVILAVLLYWLVLAIIIGCYYLYSMLKAKAYRRKALSEAKSALLVTKSILQIVKRSVK